MKNYYRVMLGKKSAHIAECLAGGFIGVDADINQDLTGQLPDDWRSFNKTFAPVYLSTHPGKSRIAAGLACGALWTVAKGMEHGDTVLSPDGTGHYRVGVLTGDYQWVPDGVLPHRRAVTWQQVSVDRAQMSDALRGGCSSFGTLSNITAYAAELEQLISGAASPASAVVASDASVQDVAAFALEKHLEEFLVTNWSSTELGKTWDIYEDESGKVGKQYQTDTGPLDILCVRKDKKALLVVELKLGRPSDAVVGQILRYMAFVREELAEDYQEVRGIVIALEDDQRIRRALAMVPSVEFYRYQISFKLVKGGA